MFGKRRAWSAIILAAGLLVWSPANALAAASTDVGSNVAKLLEGYAADFYGAATALFSLVFLGNRRYQELGVFVVAAIVVAWLVFAPADISKAAETIAKQIFG